MTCYFRHMNELFDELNVRVTSENKKDIDRRIHALVGVEYKDCSAAWKRIKELREADEERFKTDLAQVSATYV